MSTHLDSRSSSPHQGDSFATEVHSMLRPVGRVIHVTLEIAQARERGLVVFGGEPNTREEPTSVEFSPVRTFNIPFVFLVVPNGRLDVLVVLDVGFCIPLLLNIAEIPLQFGPARIPLLEGEVLIEISVEELVDWRLGIHSGCKTDNNVSWRCFLTEMNVISPPG